jgi:predicted MPP superfamily phosphohydrolase
MPNIPSCHNDETGVCFSGEGKQMGFFMSDDGDKQDGRQYRTMFLSDIHLGSKAAKADFLLDFLRYNEAETIVLVGDIVDGWRLKRSWHWPQNCNDVVQKLLRKGRKGSRII